MTETELIAHGRDLAWNLSANIESQGYPAGDRIRAGMSTEDRAALGAFRDHQIATLVGSVEDSEAGAEIRFAEAKKAYAKLVADSISASIKG